MTLSILLATCIAYAISTSSCGGGLGGSAGINPPAESTGPTTVQLSSTELSFGTQPVAITSSPQPITLTNTGKSTLRIASLSVTGSDAKNFSETNSCVGSVRPGQKCTIAILFTPAATHKHKATLGIASNAVDSPQTVELSGKGAHDVILTWSPSPTPGITGYIVYRSIAKRNSAKALNSTPIAGTMFADIDVQPSKQYQYWITAVGSMGVIQSHDSPGALATVPSP